MEEVIQLPNKNKMHKDLAGIRCNSLSVKKPQQAGQLQQSQPQIQAAKHQSQTSINQSSLQYQQIMPSVQVQQSKLSGKYISPYSQRNPAYGNQSLDNQDLQKAKEELRRQKEIYEKLNEFLNDPCFQETEFERIFMESVVAVKSKKQNNSSLISQKNDKLPAISKDASFKDGAGSEQSSRAKISESTLDFTQISDGEFNDFVKRQILEEFLSREEIKRYLYTLIFSP